MKNTDPNVKTIELCILDSNNYFVGTKIVHRDPKNKDTFGDAIDAHEIHKPDMNKILDNYKAKWDTKKNDWIYEDSKPKKPFDTNEMNPMYYFRISRQRKLDYVEEYVLQQIQKGTFTYPTKLKKYKQDLYDLPLMIENGNIEPPKINDNLETFNNTKNPEDAIIFNWPQFAFKV